jgi:mannose-6-phosphate isomerase-like protein (cupin superfamily)
MYLALLPRRSLQPRTLICSRRDATFRNESDRGIFPDQTGRLVLAAIEHDANSKRGFPGAERERDLGARLWRLPPRSANTLHRHVRAEEFYFVVEGVGRMRVGDETITVPEHGGVLVGPQLLRQVFNDTAAEALWLIIGAPEADFDPPGTPDLSLIYPVDPTQLPKELAGTEWPPQEGGASPSAIADR